MFGGIQNFPMLSEHQCDPSSFSSSLTNRTLIHCCQMTFKNHVSIISVITQKESWCLRCSVFTDTCNNFTFRSKMLNSIKAVWLRSWGFIARLNSWPFTLPQCIRESSSYYSWSVKVYWYLLWFYETLPQGTLLWCYCKLIFLFSSVFKVTVLNTSGWLKVVEKEGEGIKSINTHLSNIY